MCGINGLLYFDRARPVAADIVKRMSDATRHRGPDDHGLYARGNVGLGFNRLSIIDLSGGHQPMANEDGTVWIVFNGEIYNFLELHRELARRGHVFRTRSDTETIIHAWEEWGERCVEKLRGMFAFAVWDERRRILFGARDRLGIKPFYYFYDGERFAFASEIKSLLEVPGAPREVDAAAITEFLLRRYVIAPYTMLRGIRKLEPGHTVRVMRDEVRTERYWDLPMETDTGVGEAAAVEQAGALLEESLRMHLVSDVPLGAFLSGGIDSSCVVGLMAGLGVQDIQTFSIGYDSAESELDFARMVAERFHTRHHELRLTSAGFRDILPKIVWHMDEPVGDTACIPLFYLSRFARTAVTVVLSGEGSDELFAGYPIYRRMLHFELYNRAPFAALAGYVLGRCAGDSKARKYADMLGRPLEARYGGVGGLFSQAQAARLFPWSSSLDGVAGAYRRCAHLPALARMSYIDLKTWLADDLLVKADRMTMANSLELRVPFLDHKLVEFAARLPQRLKINGKTSKYLLKKWAGGLLPERIIHRSKKGFPVPTKSWFRSSLAGYARETLLSSHSAAGNFFSRAEMDHLLQVHRREDRSDQIYSLLVFEQWHRQFVKPAPVETAQVIER